MSNNDKMLMHLIVPAALVGTIIELVSGEGIVVKVETHTDEKKVRFANGKRNKGIKGDDLLLSLLKACAMTSEAIEKAFIAKGFARSSVSPTVSKLRNNKKIARNDKGLWHLT
jgi:hypothetical protein